MKFWREAGCLRSKKENRSATETQTTGSKEAKKDRGEMAALQKKGGRAKSVPMASIGIIGGSGLYSMAGLTDVREIRVRTPFGDPSDAIVLGTLEGKRVAFLARHAR